MSALSFAPGGNYLSLKTKGAAPENVSVDGMERKDVLNAIVEGRASDSRKFTAYIELGDIHLKNNRSQEASNYYLSAYYYAHSRRDKITSLIRLSDINYMMGSLGKAIEFAKEACALSPRDILLRKKLAGYYCEAELWKQASEEYKKILRSASLTPDDEVDILFRLGDIYERLGIYSEAIDCYKKILIMNAGSAAENAAKRRLAGCYEKTSDFELAETLLKESLAVRSSGDSDGYLALGRLYYSSGKYDSAAEAFSSSLAYLASTTTYNDSNNAAKRYEALIMTGISYIKSGRYEEAIEIFGIARHDEDDVRMGDSGTLISASKDDVAARRNAVSHFFSGIAFYRKGDFKSALAEFKVAQSLSGDTTSDRAFIKMVAGAFIGYTEEKMDRPSFNGGSGGGTPLRLLKDMAR